MDGAKQQRGGLGSGAQTGVSDIKKEEGGLFLTNSQEERKETNFEMEGGKWREFTSSV